VTRKRYFKRAEY